MTYKFKFVLWKEIWNTFLHILVGAVVAHTFLPYLPLALIIFILYTIGTARELAQWQHGKIQTWWISTIDAASFAAGGYLWWAIVIQWLGINVDLL